MKKNLTKIENKLFHFTDGRKKEGKNDKMLGYCYGLYGNCSGLYGGCSLLSGDCSGLRGDCYGLYGNCSGLRGDLDDCEITKEDRKKGIDITDLIN